MTTQRLLLPFMHGLNDTALEYAVRLAYSRGATLVALSLIKVARPQQSARMEQVQQSKDFLAAIQRKASRFNVPVECHEVYTHNVHESLVTLPGTLHCQYIAIMVKEEKGVLLPSEVINPLLKANALPLLLVHLPAKQQSIQKMGRSFSVKAWIQARSQPQDQVIMVQPYPVPEKAEVLKAVGVLEV